MPEGLQLLNSFVSLSSIRSTKDQDGSSSRDANGKQTTIKERFGLSIVTSTVFFQSIFALLEA